MKKKTWRLILLSFLALIIIVLAVLPGIVRRNVVKNSKELLGRKIELEGLSVNYFAHRISLRDFVMFEANEKDVFIKFDTLIVDLVPFQLIKGDIDVEQLYLSGLRAKIVQNDTLFNFTDLIDYHQPEESEDVKPEDADSSSSFTFQLENIELFESELIFEDGEINEQISLKGINLFIPYFGWDKSIDRASGLKFNFENGGFIQLNADWDPETKNLEGLITIDSLDLKNFAGYSKKFINFGSIEGTLDAKINVHRPVKDLNSLKLFGKIDVNRFVTTSKEEDTLAQIENFHLVLTDIKPLERHFIIDSVVLNKPKILFEKYDSIRTNFGDLMIEEVQDSLQTEKVAAIEKSEPEIASLFYAINSFQINQGAFDFEDKSFDKTFTYELSDIETSVDSISSDTRWINVLAQMKLNKRGNLQAELSLDMMNPMELELYYVITDFQLSDLNIYSTYYAGLPILYGNMYYKSETTIRDGILESKNELVLEDVELGEQSTSLIDLPLGLALFILKDKNGNITLDVPVKGDLNDPGISIKKIVWDSFKGFIGKIATAPFKILGNMFGINPSDIKDIEYAYGEAELTDKHQKQLNELLTLEDKKADLDIELVYFNDVGKEKEYIAMDMIGQKFNNKKRNYIDDPKDFAKYVRKKAKNDTIDVGQACLNMVNLAKVDTLIASLKNERLNNLKSYLKTKNDSTNISFYIPDADVPKNVGSLPVFEMKYSMKVRERSGQDTEVKKDTTAKN